GELAPIEKARSSMSAAADAAGPGAPPLPGSLPPPIMGADAIEAVLALDLPIVRAREKVVEEFERRYVQRILAQHGGNVTSAAAASGIARRYFQLLKAKHQA